MNYKYSEKGTQVIQTASYTEYDRHPDLFFFLKENYENESVKILSFGCSTGEECFSLNEYLPKSEIIGADINKRSLEKAQSKNQNGNIKFIYSNEENIKQNGLFDVILANSVLCKNPEAKYLEDISMIFPFSDFELYLQLLDKVLKKDGLLIIRSSNFLFKDSEISEKYETIVNEKSRKPIKFPKFDKHNRRLWDYLDTEEIFKKVK